MRRGRFELWARNYTRRMESRVGSQHARKFPSRQGLQGFVCWVELALAVRGDFLETTPACNSAYQQRPEYRPACPPKTPRAGSLLSNAEGRTGDDREPIIHQLRYSVATICSIRTAQKPPGFSRPLPHTAQSSHPDCATLSASIGRSCLVDPLPGEFLRGGSARKDFRRRPARSWTYQ